MTARTVLIVGAMSDIGVAIARAFAARGDRLILWARSPERLARDAVDLGLRAGKPVETAGFDVLDTASHARLLDRLAPFPDIVVVVVGLLGDQAISARDPAAAETVMRTNYVGPALLLGEIANRMEARGGGTIVALSSVAGERGRASNYVYGSGKAGLTAFLSGLRNRLAATGVRVVTVKPGFVATRMTEGMKLPALLTVRPDAVADAVLGAVERRRDIVYVGRVWAIIMAIIRLLPEPVFKRTRL